MKNDHNMKVSNNSENVCTLLRHNFFKKMQRRGSYFYKNKKYRPLEADKFFSLNSFQKMLIFHKCVSSENTQCFVGTFLERT